jgi:hypothetical protein
MNNTTENPTNADSCGSLSVTPCSALSFSSSDFAHALVCADWVASFQSACNRAGGGAWDSVKGMTVEEAMHLLAPNGIRFCYDYAAHIEKAQEVAEQMKRALPFLPNV